MATEALRAFFSSNVHYEDIKAWEHRLAYLKRELYTIYENIMWRCERLRKADNYYNAASEQWQLNELEKRYRDCEDAIYEAKRQLGLFCGDRARIVAYAEDVFAQNRQTNHMLCQVSRIMGRRCSR